MTNKTYEYMLTYQWSFKYYDTDKDEERTDYFSKKKFFNDIYAAKRCALSLPDNCENICIYQLVEKYEDEE